MLIVFRRGLAIPLGAVVLGAVALSAPPRVLPSLIALLGIAIVARAMPAIVRRLGPSRPRVDVLPAEDRDPEPEGLTITARARIRTLDEAFDARASKADDATDLVRMDDDGGWQMALRPAPGSPARGRGRSIR